LIEAVMLVMLGFLCATLLALAAVPALARRADRLARKRAEAAFPLSLAEIAADRDHLRAELALRARTLEQQAERGFAAKAGAMQEVGRRDMDIAQLKRDLAARDGRIADLEGDLSTTRTELDGTRASLAAEMAAHADTAQTLEKRVADLAALEQNLAETRHALTGTGVDLSERTSELENERATLGRVQALLAQRETELANQCTENDRLRVAHVEGRTQIMVLEGKSEDLAQRLDTAETTLAQTSAALKAMTTDRDSERLRANTLEARAVQAEAGLAAAAAAALETAQAGLLVARGRRDEEIMTMREDLREREQRIETLHAEIQTLQGALSQARSDRQRLKREVAQAGKAAATKAAPAADNAALRKQIVEIADRLMSLEAKREAAE
jgi:chromosome segregation ATPase